MNIRTSIILNTVISLLLSLSAQAGSITGTVNDEKNVVLDGVDIIIENEGIGTTTNQFGKYSFDNLISGNYELVFTYVGYKSISINIELGEGESVSRDITLKEDILNLGTILVTAQKKAEQIQDVPISISALDNDFLDLNSPANLDILAGYVPGMNIFSHSMNRPNFVIRGLTSDAFLASAQPRVSVFYNNIPISRTSGAFVELYDMERIEILKGPQGTLFGRGAQIGAVHYISNKPNNTLHGNVFMGFGNNGQNYYNAMINLPLTDNLFTRIAATYIKRDGFVQNTFGGNLNERNTAAIRSSFRYISNDKTIVDLLIEYQKDTPGGTAFMSRTYPNRLGQIDVFGKTASFEQGANLGLKRNIFNATLNAVHYFNNSLDLTTIVSYREHTADEIWDGDGSAAPALDFTELIDTDQITLESRLNYRIGKRFRGFAGVSYWKENVNQTVRFSPNEQSLFFLFFNPPNLVDAMGNPNFIPVLPPLPELGPLGGTPLPSYHVEESFQKAVNSAAEFFVDGTYQATQKLNLTLGLRAIADRLSLEGRNRLFDGEPSTLGYITGNYPNVLIKAGEIPEEKKKYTSIVGRVITQYAFSEELNTYIGYSRGRRPHVIQVRADAQTEILDDEKVNSFDLGIKGHIFNQFLYDFAAYYYDYSDFQTRAWIADQQSGEFQLIVKDGGKAHAYGMESNLQYAVNQNVKLFANYAYIHARFDNEDNNGNRQDYAGNHFRLTPDHTASLRANLTFLIFKSTNFYLNPSYVYKSHHFFEDDDTKGLDQSDYGLLHVQSGVYLNLLHLEVSLFAYNLLDQKYLVSAGNTGNLFGIPTFVAGTRRTVGLQVKFDF
jgi:outer membrane receptor protein involved in Fe transport